MTDATLAKLQALLESNPHIEVAWLYGSRAKGDHTPSSDYDVAVAFDTFESSQLKARLRPETLALDIQHSLGLGDDMISVVDVQHAPLGLLHSIFKQPVVLKNANNERLMREEIRAFSLWEDAHA